MSPDSIPCNRSSTEPLSHIENPNPITVNHDLIVENEPTTTTNSEQPASRRSRPSRACTVRAAERLVAAQSVVERKPKPKPEQPSEDSPPLQQCSSKIVTQLVEEPSPSQLPRWSLRSKWELASVLNFLHVFRELLNIHNEFTVEEFETALITPNDTLSDIHIPLLKAIPPITRMALTRNTWVTVMCRKLRDWWHWVAEGDLPIVASHGVEIEVYKNLDPGMRVVILKALCDIRVEQEDIRSYIENSLKHGVQLSAFRKERIGGDSHGTYFWYEDDPVIGQRLYREIRKVELKKGKAKGSQVLPCTTYQWETVATNFDEFQDVSEKLFTSNSRSEASLGKKLKKDMLPEIEKVHKRKEKLLKKQHRQALLLDNFALVDGLGPGRSLRDRKPVTYTFDDYDRSINEAIKTTKFKPPSPELNHGREAAVKLEPSTNGKWSGPSYASQNANFSALSPKSPDYDDADEDHMSEEIDRSNRRRQRPQRYSGEDYVEALSDNDADFGSDDDIVGEAVYDEEYLRKRKKRRKASSSSEGDEEYHYEEENEEEEEEEEEDEEESLSISEDSDRPRKVKKMSGRTRRETKLRSRGEIQSGLRRSKRANRSRINYGQYDVSESEPENNKVKKTNASDEHTDARENGDYSADSQGSDNDNEDDEEDEDQEMKVDQPDEVYAENIEAQDPPEKPNSLEQDETEGARKTQFLDLNELASGSGFDDAPTTEMKDDTDEF